MNITFEKKLGKPQAPVFTPLMVKGKNLIKLQSIRTQTRTNASSFDKMPKCEMPEKDLSFISEILGRNIERNSWLLSAFQKQPKKNNLLTDQEDSEANLTLPPSRPSDLPLIKEKSFQIVRPKPKRSSIIIRKNKLPIELYNQYLSLLQISNGIEITNQKREYKYYVGSGNNDSLVNRIMKKKPGWVKVYTPHSAHFIWTQLRKSSVILTLPSSQDRLKKMYTTKSTNFSMFPIEEYVSLAPLTLVHPSKSKVYNRIERNFELCSKKRLFTNMLAYYKVQGQDPFLHIPLTFHVTNGVNDHNFLIFKQKFQEFQEKIDYEHDEHLTNLWLVKPGEATNRGIGISICSNLSEIEEKLEDIEYAPGKSRTYIIQKYIYRPLLYFGRKFDIRCYTLVTCYNGNTQAYFYREGYLRTAIAEFSLKNNSNKFIHLTNDAIQKKSSDYGKFEAGNKLNYAEFQEYINNNLEKKVNFKEEVLPKILNLVRDSLAGTFKKLDPKKRLHTFEILGYDFMLDEFFHPWLIEVNTNPCLALSGPYLASLIPKMIEDALHIALDQFFHMDLCDFTQNNFSLVFSKSKGSIEHNDSIELLESDGESSDSNVEAN